MKKKLWIPIILVLVLLLAAVGVLRYLSAHSLGISVGRVLHAGDSVMLIKGSSPIEMTDRRGEDSRLSALSDGDKILVLHDGILETYPGRTGVYAVIRLSEGSIADIPDEVLSSLAELGRETDVKIELPEIMPDDFSFALTWGCWGISSYDSRTGRLVKTTDATHPEDYVTAYTLTAEQTQSIYDLLRALNVNGYPTIYNPHDGIASSPPMSLILTVRIGDRVKQIKAENIAISYETNHKEGQRFLTACKTIQEILTSTEEWKVLPDYEFYYD